jgi:DNA ligase-1
MRITLHKPIRPVLAERPRNAQEVIEQLNGDSGAVEYKLDGERVQIHKGGDRVQLFSRRLENIASH